MKKSASRHSLMATAVASSLVVSPVAPIENAAALPKKPVPFTTARFGVNLASAEFGHNHIRGEYGLHYIYPPVSSLAYYKSKKRTLIRLPFLWERIQPTLNGPLAASEVTHLREFLRGARQQKMDVILDIHNYGRYHVAGAEQSEIIGSGRVSYAAFADLWKKIAEAVKDEPAVYAYGLMNEPHDMEDPTRWPQAAQAAIDGIRKVDKKRVILVAGDNWSSARGWRTGPNETLNEKVRDPQNNLVFEAHCYFDKDNSGSYKKGYVEEGATPDIGVEYVRPFVEWCKAKGVRGFVGEYGVPDDDPRWLITTDRFMEYLQKNKVSSAYWAGGPWWGNYRLAVEPQDARTPNPSPNPPDRPQMLLLRQYPG